MIIVLNFNISSISMKQESEIERFFDDALWEINSFFNFSKIFNIPTTTHMDRDLLHPTLDTEKQRHKLKRLVPTPNSYFMDVKCGGCNETAIVFSHAQTVVACNNCKNILSKPTGGKCKLTEGSAFKVKN